MEDYKIRCPNPECQWEPDEESLWICTCGNEWNTFKTTQCGNEKCEHIWSEVNCPYCDVWSLRESWYERVSL